MEKKIIGTICVISLMLVFLGTSVNADHEEISTADYIISQNCNECPINITVHDAWDLLTDTGNGIQIPIDVRSEQEWNYGFIDTPYPECPRWYVYEEFQYNATFLQWFIDEYAGQELVIYCASGMRSKIVSSILCDTGFTGIVNNMLGGINAWKDEGYPIRNNTPPAAPDLNGPTNVKVNTPTNYMFSTTDLESDVVYYWIKWCEDNITEWDGPYASGEEVVFIHSWCHKGTFTIKAKAMDFYGYEGNWTELEIIVPRNKIVNRPLIQFLQSHPNLFPILQKLLLIIK